MIHEFMPHPAHDVSLIRQFVELSKQAKQLESNTDSFSDTPLSDDEILHHYQLMKDGALCFVEIDQNGMIEAAVRLKQQQKQLELCSIVVAKDARRRKVGSRVLGEVLDLAVLFGSTEVRLYAKPGTEAFYEANGFMFEPDESGHMVRSVDDHIASLV